MDSSDLTTEQATVIRDRIRQSLVYFNQLQRRMEQRSFPPSDHLYQMILTAKSALQAALMEAHYESCKHGVGGPEKKQ
jgi:hypothetical protein